jgi:hypothetical protein
LKTLGIDFFLSSENIANTHVIVNSINVIEISFVKDLKGKSGREAISRNKSACPELILLNLKMFLAIIFHSTT